MYQVLVADDEPIERKVICKKIRENFKMQLEPIEAINGREAIACYKEHKCPIVLLDIEMPGISGLEAAKSIREMDKNCSIIFLTAFDYFNYAKKAITVKALDYLLKPSSDEELVAALEEAIRIADEEMQEIEDAKDDKEESLHRDNQNLEEVRSSLAQESILEFIKQHYMYDISLQDAAKAMNYSDAYFCKLFKQYFGKSFTTYLSQYRVEKAKGLMMDLTINVKDIGDQVGYRDSNYFAKVFKRVVGVTPSEYRLLTLKNKRAK